MIRRLAQSDNYFTFLYRSFAVRNDGNGFVVG